MSPHRIKLITAALLGTALFAGATPAFAAEPVKTVDVSPTMGAITVPVPTLGTHTVVPGDAASDTVRLRNTSKKPLKVTAQLQVVDKQLNPLDTLNTDLIFTANLGKGEYTVPARDLETSPEVESTLPAGETADYTLGFNFPETATSGRTSLFGDQHVTLAVKLRVSEIPEPTPTPTNAGLAVTGANTVGITVFGIALTGLGACAVIAKRRRTEGAAK